MTEPAEVHPLLPLAALALCAGAPPVSAARLRVTTGALLERAPGQLRVEAPELRAVVKGGAPARAVRARFTYRGPTEAVAPLASGEVRRQLALKLRAQDGCNVVYVAWRFAPRPQVAVSVKSNPGRSTHAACGAGGYRTVRPRRAAAAPPVEVGAPHELSAALQGRELLVRADGLAVWEGALPDAALAFDGPAGIRTDNAILDLQLWTDVEEGR